MWTLPRIASAITFAFFLARRGYKKKSLNLSGAIMGGTVAAIHILASNNAIFLMAVFYFTSSYLTKYKAEIKKKIEEDFLEGGQRNWVQVLANGGIGVVLSIIWIYLGNAGQDLAIDFKNNFWSSVVLLGWVGQYACANGDTWSSELGILSKGEPRLVTTLGKVPKGTNGGVSLLGLAASFGGGLLIGVTAYLCNILFAPSSAVSQLPLITLGIIGGLGGSLVDSFLGATVQYSGWDPKQQKVVKAAAPGVKHITGLDILDNHQVNFAANLLSTVLLPVIGMIMFR